MNTNQMNKRHFLLSTLLLTGATSLMGQSARFDYFEYEGRDARFDKSIDLKHEYLNPVVSGYYPDPSMCRVGDTYYLVNSTFSYFPGVPIHTSKDLVNWTQLGHVLDRQSQVSLEGQQLSGGIFAPQISYNPRNKTFYMTTGDMGRGYIFYVKSTDPSKGWSEPIEMKHGGMDTSFFFDTDGRAWVVYNSDPIEHPAQWNMQKAILMNEFDWRADTICDKTYQLTTGSTCTPNPIWIEGPHLYKIGKYYYLMAAENGTGYNHSEVIFRTRKLTSGKWEECPFNPILTQRDLGPRPEPVSSAGHADLIQAKDKSWWAVFLGCRPYEGDAYNTGRETFLLPVTWKDGWPQILPHQTAVPTVVDKPGLQPLENQEVTGNYKIEDHFDTGQLNPRWVFLREPDMTCYDWSGKGISLRPTTKNLKELTSPTALLYRQKHTTFTAETQMEYAPQTENDLAGLTVFQNDRHHFVMGLTLQDGQPVLTLTRVDDGRSDVLATHRLADSEKGRPLRLRVDGDGRWYTFMYSGGEASWHTLAEGCDGLLLSTGKAGGFVGSTIGLYATSKK